MSGEVIAKEARQIPCPCGNGHLPAPLRPEDFVALALAFW